MLFLPRADLERAALKMRDENKPNDPTYQCWNFVATLIADAPKSLEAEPKDPLWSAAMEQQVREAVARHSLSDRFVLSEVDCRTLFCDVKAEMHESGGLEGREAFHRVIADLAPSLDMPVGGSGSGSLLPNGLIDAHARLRRFKLGDDCPPGFQPDCWNR